ncbi:molybdopterin-dependent oxidoreductase [Kitasatospora aburaviensis]
MGLNQSTHGTWNTNALVNLHLATGAICRPGSGPFSLTGQPNAMGGREMGYMGPGLPGQRSVLVPEERAFVEELWGLPAGTLRAEAGRGTVDMFERMADGEIKACWIICTNPVASVANRKTVIAGLEAAELVITQDVFADTETNAYADVVLPAVLWTEAEGCWSTPSATSPWPGRSPDRSARHCRTGRSSPASPARWASRPASPTRAPRRSSRRSSGRGTPRPAGTCAG